MNKIYCTAVSFLLLLVCLVPVWGAMDERNRLEEKYREHAVRWASQDSFRVLHDPRMDSKTKADVLLEDHQWVIGLEHNGEAKAYPVRVMGLHELVNDTIGGLPVAVCW